MTPAELRALLEARPFVPFRLVMRDGTGFEVHEPHGCWVGLASVAICCPDSSHLTGADNYYMVPLQRIARLERLFDPAADTKNSSSPS
jgi:hypothetical protein